MASLPARGCSWSLHLGEKCWTERSALLPRTAGVACQTKRVGDACDIATLWPQRTPRGPHVGPRLRARSERSTRVRVAQRDALPDRVICPIHAVGHAKRLEHEGPDGLVERCAEGCLDES